MWPYVLCSLSTSSAFSVPHLYVRLTTAVEDEEVLTVEERCCHLDNFAAVTVGGKHSYLVVTTRTGRKVRFDYYAQSQQLFAKQNYWELLQQEVFRKATARPGVTVKDVQRIFQQQIWKENYSAWSHNCQHVVLATYNEVTGLNEKVLRNDYLIAYANYLPAYLRKRFQAYDTQYELKKEAQRLFNSEVQASADRSETIWKFMKSQRFDLLSRLLKLSPGLLPKDYPLLPGEKKAMEGDEADFWAPLDSYEQELLAWEQTK